MFWIKFFTMVKALIGYQWAFWRANNWPWPWPCTTELERLPFVNKNREFRLEIQMAQLIPPESVRKRWKSSDVFPFPVPTGMNGKSLYHLPSSPWRLFLPFTSDSPTLLKLSPNDAPFFSAFANQWISKDIPSYGSQSKRAKIAIHWFGKY